MVESNLFKICYVNNLIVNSRSPEGKCDVRLIGDPDYERKSVYQIKVIAADRSNFGGTVNTATAAILVQVGLFYQLN